MSAGYYEFVADVVVGVFSLLHSPRGYPPICVRCGQSYPCDTKRRLLAAPAPELGEDTP